MSNDLFEQVQSWGVSESLSIKNISTKEQEEVKTSLAEKDNLSTKQFAVLNDILTSRLRDIVYATTALEYYAKYIKELITTFERDSIEDNNSDILEILDDINSCFIRSFIIKKNHKIDNGKDKWDGVVSIIYDFLVKYSDEPHLFRFFKKSVECFLLLVVQGNQNSLFKDVAAIYLRKCLEDDWRELGWVFGDKLILPADAHLFNNYNNANNLENIICAAKKSIQSLVTNNQKEAVVDSCIKYTEEIKKYNTDFVLPPPDWILKLANKNQEDVIKRLLESIPSSSAYNPKHSEIFYHSKSIQELIKAIKNSESSSKVIKAIVDSNGLQLVNDSINIFENFLGPNNVIVSQGRSITGETRYEDSKDIRRQKLNLIYKEIFKFIPYQTINLKILQDLLKEGSVIKSDFHQVLKSYLKSILNPNIECWQKEANINQIVLLMEPILASLNPTKYAKLIKNNKNGCVELTGIKYAEFIKGFFLDMSEEHDFLLQAFIDHRNIIAHGKTYIDFGNCYLSLVAIMKLLSNLNKVKANS